jgi:lysophospholipase L1-like esterase
MRRRLISVAILATLWATSSAYANDEPAYYLALGDSLAVGVQPSSTGVDVRTNQGYADDLYAFYRTRIPGLKLAKLGCSGETVATMLFGGGPCKYRGNNQLAAAMAFLQSHRVAFVTLDIGANDVDTCISQQGIDDSCVQDGINAVLQDLPLILAALRSVAPEVPIFAMNYYDAFLGLWRFGPLGQQIAIKSLPGALAFNTALATVYKVFGVPVADVAAAFHITDTTPVPLADVPVNVFLTLAWTWMGAPPPIGPNVHPNAIGYVVIAGAFVKTIGTP